MVKSVRSLSPIRLNLSLSGSLGHEVYTVIPKDEAEHVTLLKPHEKLPLSVYIGAAGVPGASFYRFSRLYYL